MGCEQIRLLLSAYLDKATAEQETRAVEDHLRNCAVCREELSQLRSLCLLLHGLKRPRPPFCLWAAIRNRLHV